MTARRFGNVDMEVAPWRAVNDSVMGGLSVSEMVATEHGLRFQGALSLENSGGFASIRRPFHHELDGIDGIRLRVCGDGRRYQFSLRLRDRSPGVSWRAAVDTDGSWQTVILPPGNFVPVVRGRPVAGSAPIVSGTVCRVGFLLADRQPGRFGLEIAAIEFLFEANA